MSSDSQSTHPNPPPSVNQADFSSSSSKKKKKNKHLSLDVSEGNVIMTSCHVNDEDEDEDEDLSPTVNTTTGPLVLELDIFNKPSAKPDPKIYLDDAWAKVKPAIEAIFLNEAKQLDHTYVFKFLRHHPTAIFNAVGDAWVANSGEKLYQMILDECETYISKDFKSLEGKCKEENSSAFLQSVVNCWLVFLCRMRSLCDIAGSGRHTLNRKELPQLVKELFPKQLELTYEVHNKVLSSILDLIKDQRSGKSVDTSQLKNLMDMFYGPSFYKQPHYFEEPFVSSAIEFYSKESDYLLKRYEISKYLKHVERRFREEKEKCNSLYFFQLFREPLIKTVHEQLLVSHASVILDKGFAELMNESRHDDLRRMYVLFSEANILDHINSALSSYISKAGEKIKREGSSLEQFKRSVDKIWYSDFSENQLLKGTVKQCFQDLGLL